MYVVRVVLVMLSLGILSTSDAAMTMKQLKNSLEMMRKACAPKFNVVDASLDELKAGRFANEADKELKCYTMCIAQMAGTEIFSPWLVHLRLINYSIAQKHSATAYLAQIYSTDFTLYTVLAKKNLTKKGELSLSKTTAQIEAMLPQELKAAAKEALNACKDIQSGFKDPCEKVYYSAKCAAEYNPDVFFFP